MRQAVFVEAARSPIGKVGGGLSKIRPDDLLSFVLKGLVQRAGIEGELVEDVYAGCGNQAGEDNRDVARMAVLLAGFPSSVSGVTVNRNCASGLEAINQAAKAIHVGEGEVFIGAGVESMSRAPWVIPKPDKAHPIGHPSIYDTTVGWRFPNPHLDTLYPIVSLGQTAENVAQEMNISREEQDAYALESHRRAVTFLDQGKFKEEIIPVPIPQKKGPAITVEWDEHPRYKVENGHFVLNTSLEQLARLKPAFKHDGTVTAGNASGVNDGAAAVLLMSEEKARELGLKPMARWVGSSVAGVDPGVMGYGPIPATRKLLDRWCLPVNQLGLVEVNEAFAATTIAVIRELGMDPDKTNVNGGAIALGHPLGCSGARIMTTLLHEMKRRASQVTPPFYGLATLCVGVGQGVATLVEWIYE